MEKKDALSTARGAIDALLAEGIGAARNIRFRPESVDSAAEAVGYLGDSMAQLPGAIKQALEAGRNSGALLSTDRLQGISEVVQNADDTGATEVRISIIGDDLLIAHNGKPLELQHVFAIAMPWITTKADDVMATGRHGIGLMTLRSLSPVLDAHCSPYHVRLSDSGLTSIAPSVHPHWLSGPGWTTLRIPVAPHSVSVASLSQWLSSWGDAGLLFLSNVTRVALLDDGADKYVLNLAWEEYDLISASLNGRTTGIRRRMARLPSGASYRVYLAEFPSPADVNRARKAKGQTTPVGVALPDAMATDSNWMHSGLPLAPIRVPARINAQFDPLTNRQGAASTAWNDSLIPLIAGLWVESIVDSFLRNPAETWALIPTQTAFSGDVLPEKIGLAIVEASSRELPHRVRLHPQADDEPVLLSALCAEALELEGVLTSEEVAALADRTAAIPQVARDATGTWRTVLAGWNADTSACHIVSVRDSLALLHNDISPEKRTSLVSVALAQDELQEEVSRLPAIQLSSGQAVALPRNGQVRVFTAHTHSLAVRIGIGLALHPVYTSSTSKSSTVLTWLRSNGALLSDDSPLATLKHLAAAGESGASTGFSFSDEQALALRDAMEAIATPAQQSLGHGIGAAVQFDCFRFEGKGTVKFPCTPVAAYLPRAIDKEPESFAVAAGKVAGVTWLSAKYASVLKSSSGRTGLGAQRFFRLLGAETAPRIERHPHLHRKFFNDHKSGLHLKYGPQKRIEVLRGLDTDYTLEDYQSPLLEAVIGDIANDKASARRTRAKALLSTIARAWDRLEPLAYVHAVSAYYAWNHRGSVPAYWMFRIGDVAWLDDVRGRPRRPAELRLKTAATAAIWGTAGGDFLRQEFDSPGRRRVLQALGVQGEPTTPELVKHLKSLRQRLFDHSLTVETAITYSALAERYAPGGEREMSTDALRRGFADGHGLILSSGGWKAPDEVLLGPPVFRHFRSYVPAVPGADNLWKALGVRAANLDDCVSVLQEVSKSRVQNTDDRSVAMETIRMLARLVAGTQLDATRRSRLRRIPLWTNRGWTADRPVFAVSETAVSAALSERVATWDPGTELTSLGEIFDLVGVTLISSDQSAVHDADASSLSPNDTSFFRRAVSLLHDDLSRNDPGLAAALRVQWDDLAGYTVHLNLHLAVTLSGVEGWDSRERISVDAKIDVERRVLFVRESAHVQKVDAGGRAIASLFQSDARRVSYAWRVACDKAAEGLESDNLIAAEEAHEDGRRILGEEMAERLREVQRQVERRRSTATEKTNSTSSTAPSPPPGSQAALIQIDRPSAPRILVSPQDLVLKPGAGTIQIGVPKTTNLAPDPLPKPLKPVRNVISSPVQRQSAPMYTDLTKETLALELVRQVLACDDQQLKDLRNQRGVGADAIDELEQFFELKAYAGSEPDSISLTDAEIKRATTTEGFFLVVVSSLEGHTSKPQIRIIPRPLEQLGISPNSSISLTGIKNATSLKYEFDNKGSNPSVQ